MADRRVAEARAGQHYNAGSAEELYRQQNSTGNQDCYAIVRVGSRGNAVIEDIVLGGIPVKEAVR